jgi:hypothetical protein
MNPTIDRLKLIFLGLFVAMSLGVWVYHAVWVWPGQKCEEAGKWWDWQSRTCARPILISDITGRVISDPKAREAAKAAAAKARGEKVPVTDLNRAPAKN